MRLFLFALLVFSLDFSHSNPREPNDEHEVIGSYFDTPIKINHVFIEDKCDAKLSEGRINFYHLYNAYGRSEKKWIGYEAYNSWKDKAKCEKKYRDLIEQSNRIKGFAKIKILEDGRSVWLEPFTLADLESANASSGAPESDGRSH